MVHRDLPAKAGSLLCIAQVIQHLDWTPHAAGERNVKFDRDFPTVTLRDETIAGVISKKLIKIKQTPDYRILLDYLKATSARRFAHEPKVIEPSGDPLKRRAERAREYQRYISSVRRGGEMVGLNNIGEITFVRNSNPNGSPKFMVRYFVRWFEKQVEMVVFDVSLDVRDKVFPQLPFPT